MKQVSRDELEMDFVRIAEILSALSHPLRLRMAVELKNNGPRNVKSFVDLLNVSQPAVSQHLSRMRVSGVVDMRKDGTKVIYSIANTCIERLLDCLDQHFN